MAFTLTPAYGQGGTYTAQNDRLVMQGHTSTAGVKKLTVASGGAMTGDLAVTTTGAGNGSVQVAAGGVVVAWTGSTGQGHYYAYNDAATTVGAFAANASGNPRIDLVSVQITDTGVSAPTAAFVITQGTAASTPVAPAVPANATPIAAVTIPNGFTTSTTVSNANIGDVRRKAYLPDVSLTSTSSTVVPSPSAGNIGYRVDDQRLNAYNASAVEGARWENIPERTGFRNMLINGAMNVSQRQTSVASITSSASVAYYTVDRFAINLSSLGTWTQTQASDAPTGTDFRTSLKMQCTVANASPAAGSLLLVSQTLEGQDCQMIRKGTANARPITLSFWAKTFQTGTFIVEIYDGTNGRSICAPYTMNASGTWEFKTITFAGDTTGVLANDNTGALQIRWWLGAGTNYTSGTLQTAWGTTVSANLAVGQTNVASSTSNYWQMTGAQLELGSVPSQFERRPFAQELILCQRYYQKSYPQNQYPGQVATLAGYLGYAAGASYPRWQNTLPVVMRSAPNLTFYAMDGTAGQCFYWNNGATGNAGIGNNNSCETSIGTEAQFGTTSARFQFYGHYVAEKEL